MLAFANSLLPKVHRAGTPARGQQRCADCGHLLIERSGCMVIATAGPPRDVWWPEGSRVAVSPDGKGSWLAGPKELSACVCTRAPEVPS